MRAAWISGNLHSGCALFHSILGRKLAILRFPMGFLSLYDQIPGYHLDYAMTVPSKSFPIIHFSVILIFDAIHPTILESS